MSANRIVVHNAETFQDSVSVQITEAGIYTIQLTNPEWVYMIEGTFKYPKDYQAIEEIDAAVPTIRKVLRDGRLVLQIGNHIYTITGSQIQ
jgi:methionine synthase II (cobalamin-independent)